MICLCVSQINILNFLVSTPSNYAIIDYQSYSSYNCLEFCEISVNIDTVINILWGKKLFFFLYTLIWKVFV